MEDVETVPPLLPLYEAELDVTGLTNLVFYLIVCEGCFLILLICIDLYCDAENFLLHKF